MDGMKIKEVAISESFKKQVKKTKYSIVLFVLVYLLLFLLALALTALSVYGGLLLIIAFPKFITILLGAGLASFGLLILIFLIKFLFKSHKSDYSHLTEITREDEPELFTMLDELTYKIDTKFPKKVFLSTDVNAAVFYDSSFWSMFFPIKKNLQIGLGLVNTISKDELKAILSHEFGHFSQKSMKAGSYVYNVNQVIYNMLFDNESFDNLVERWASTSGFIGIFVILATKFIYGIQLILQSVYKVINKNYMALSREMEFHADEIAANVTGYEPLKTSLLRMQLADFSFSTVLGFYDEKIRESIVSENIFKEQAFVMDYLAKHDEINIVNGLPDVSLNHLTKYNKSRLVIKDQWASHPSVQDRIEHLEKTNLKADSKEQVLANTLFANIEHTHKSITKKIVDGLGLQETPIVFSLEDFKTAYVVNHSKYNFSKIYNEYYDNKSPVKFDLQKVEKLENPLSVQDIYSNERVDLIYTSISIQNDLNTLELISKKEIDVKTFDYDGQKFKRSECKQVQDSLKKELDQINQQIELNDIQVFAFFKSKESVEDEGKLLELYTKFFDIDSEYDKKIETHNELTNNLQFLNHITEIEDIKRNLKNNLPIEDKLKNRIRSLINKRLELSEAAKEDFELYISKDWEYFGVQVYHDENLQMLFRVLDHYVQAINQEYFNHKKALLDYQISLL